MSIAVVLASPVMPVAFQVIRRDLFKEIVEILDQTRLIIIDVNARGDVHRIDQAKTFLDPAFAEGRFNLRSNIDIVPFLLSLKKKVFGIGFHKSPRLNML